MKIKGQNVRVRIMQGGRDNTDTYILRFFHSAC